MFCTGGLVHIWILWVPSSEQTSAKTRSRRRPVRRCSASGWLMLNVPCTEAIVVPLSTAWRRIRPATCGGMFSGMSGKPAQSRLTCTQSSPQALTASSRATSVPRPNVPSRMPIWISGGCRVSGPLGMEPWRIAAAALGPAAASKLHQPGAPGARAVDGVAFLRNSRRFSCLFGSFMG